MARPVLLEVVLAWGGDVVRVEEFQARDGRVRIGDGPDANFALPIAHDLSLATWAGDAWHITPPLAADEASDPSAACFDLAPGEQATVTVGTDLELRLRACSVPARAFVPVARTERELAATLLASFVVHACLVASAALTPSSLPMLELDRRELPLPDLPSMFVAADPADVLPRLGPSPSVRPRDRDPAGLAGDPRALRPRGGGRAVARNARASASDFNAGILGVLAAASRTMRDGTSPYDAPLASTFEGGGPLDRDLGPSRGDLGLALHGTGRGACEPGQACDAMLVPALASGGIGLGSTCDDATFASIARAWRPESRRDVQRRSDGQRQRQRARDGR